jgi:hypothetical protein
LTIAPFVGSTSCGSWPASDAAKIQDVVMVLGDIALRKRNEQTTRGSAAGTAARAHSTAAPLAVSDGTQQRHAR